MYVEISDTSRPELRPCKLEVFLYNISNYLQTKCENCRINIYKNTQINN